MAYTILAQGPGYTVAQDDEVHSSIPYAAVDRENGDRNHGFVDLVDRPELAADIPEAGRSAGLRTLLETVNGVGSPLMTLGCECGVFLREPESDQAPDRYIGSYVAIAFRVAGMNTAARIYELARAVLGRTAGSEAHHYTFEITITPLRALFGHAGCFEMHTNALGYGRDDAQAWAAFDAACLALSTAVEGVLALPRDDALFQA
jgi:hypothetical protein